MKVVTCIRCGACLAVSDGASAQINTLHVEGLARVCHTVDGLQIILRCRHCKRVTVAVFPLCEPTPKV